MTYFPPGRLLLEALFLTRERLKAKTNSKAAVPLPILREIIATAVAGLPFDEEFYLAQNPDIREAAAEGSVTDLRAHFVNEGYLEGRFGVRPDLDEVFYRETYPDVANAIANGEVASGLDHYLLSGAFEGRFANHEQMTSGKRWLELLNWK